MVADPAQRTRAYVILMLMPMLFSTNMVIGRAAVESVEPWTLSFWRWSIAFAVLLPIAGAGLWRHRRAILAEWRMIVIIAFLGMVVCGVGVYLSLLHTTAVNGTLIYTSSPAFVLLLEILFRGQPWSARQILGIALAFFGVITIVLRGDLAALGGLAGNIGDIGIAIAAIAWAVYSVLLRRSALARLPTMVLFAAIAGAGSALLLPGMLWEVAAGHFPLGFATWASIMGLALISSVLAFSAYQYGVKVMGPTVTSVFLYFLPVYGVILSVIFLGEQLYPYHAVGFVAVMAGVVLATLPGSRAPSVAP